MKWISENIVSLIAFGVSLIALLQSHRAAKLSINLERSKSLSEIYDKMRPGRQAMRTIWATWATPGKTVSTLSQRDCEKFQDYYNANFHNAPSDSEPRSLSDEIHLFMHELDRVVDRTARGEFTRSEVMRTFGHAIAMDRHLIHAYLEAHWREHEELEKPLKSRFWNNVSAIVDDAQSWTVNSQITT